jgi:acetylornithine deacetylase/succinyl-diaminopimelate desuccinylase-like protein
VAEEDNDGGGPMFLARRLFPGSPPEFLPDAVILTDSTGDARKGALGIYRGQRGRMQIEVEITGRSCHGSMPWEGLNPLEWGAAVLAEATRRHEDGQGFLSDEFLGPGTRTASWAQLDTPSDCAVPERFTFRFDRRLTAGESPEGALADVAGFDAVRDARAAGLRVEARVPVYDRPTWRGYVPGNPQIYRGWATPEDHPAIAAAVETYRGAVSPFVDAAREEGGHLRREPRVDRWVFSTDGVGYPVPIEGSGIDVPARKLWVRGGGQIHAAMFGLGVGIEQNTHKIGECSDLRELRHAIAFLARFPSVFAAPR